MFQIQDLQDISSINNSKFKKKNESFCISETIKETIEMNRMQAQQKNIEIKLAISPEVPINLKLDKKRLQQIINNLLSNAIKFSEDGMTVKVECHFLCDSKNLQLGVIDNGVGINETDVDLIFKPYKTLKTSAIIDQKGAGLGLYICKQLCQELDGNIKVLTKIDPSIGKTAFIVELKAEEVDSQNDSAANLDLDEIQIEHKDIFKSEILIFEKQIFS